MGWLSRILGVFLLLVASVLGIYAVINFNDARRWDAMAEDKDAPMSVEDIKESAAWSRSEVRYWSTISGACAVPGLALLVVPSYLERRRAKLSKNA